MPVRHQVHHSPNSPLDDSIMRVQREMDRFFKNLYSGFNPFRNAGMFIGPLAEGLLKPTLDMGANEEEYSISVEVSGVNQQDVKIEIADNTLIIRGKKKQEKEEKEKNIGLNDLRFISQDIFLTCRC